MIKIDNQLLESITAAFKAKYHGKRYVHWRDHHPRTEGKAKCLAAGDAWGALPLDVRNQFNHEELVVLGITALHEVSLPPKCYDDAGNVYVLFSDGRREFTGETYKRWLRRG